MQFETRRRIYTCLAMVASFTISANAETIQSSPALMPQANIAVIEIETPREGNLLHLRGIAGRGTATFRLNGVCSTIPVRFVAGDFTGKRVGVARTGPIRLVIRSQHHIKRLIQGFDLVSDTLRVSQDPNDPMAEIHLQRGLSSETGFIINPGDNILADIWGPRSSPIPCEDVKATD